MTMRALLTRRAILHAFVSLALINPARAVVTVYPQPEQERASADYQVFVRRAADPAAPLIPVTVYGSCQFDPASKQKLCGRAVSPLSFCSVDADEPVEIAVRFNPALAAAGIDPGKVVIRPLSLQLNPGVVAGELHFTIGKQPCQVTVEPGGQRLHPLHLFINPPEQDPPTAATPEVVYFGPGYHEIDSGKLRDGQTVYIAGGAVLELRPDPAGSRAAPSDHFYDLPIYRGPALLDARDKKRITIRGRGILSCRRALETGQRSDLLDLGGCQDLRLEGIVLRESGSVGVHVVNGAHVLIDHL